MRNLFAAVALVFLLVASIKAWPPQNATDPPPPWAYGFTAPAGPPAASPAPAPAPAAAPAPPDPTVRHVTGSDQGFTLAQARDNFGPPDWFPGGHPKMPDIVAHGRKPDIFACSFCHYPNGKGRPENAGISGLAVDYFVQTMTDFKNGNRKTADGRKTNTARMAAFAKAMTDDEIKAAAEYFGSMKWTPWIKVVETDTVPKTRTAAGMFIAMDGNDKEPLGQRIIEMPENTEYTETLRDDHSEFIAYVPMGSIAKGQTLVTTGADGKTTPCGVCHGPDLQGLGTIPGIAGRSPSYLARQLYDMKQGTRSGVWTALMKPVVEKLSDDDILAITAYLASRPVN